MQKLCDVIVIVMMHMALLRRRAICCELINFYVLNINAALHR
jgi:hypothetical protein